MFQTKVSVFEKAVILDHPIFLSVEALKLRQGQLLFLNGTMYFFSMTLLPILRQIQRPTTQGHCSHTKYENSQKIETYRIKPLKEVKKMNKKNASLENSITKKMSTGPSLYYDEFVSYDFPKIQFCLMQISDKLESLENHN